MVVYKIYNFNTIILLDMGYKCSILHSYRYCTYVAILTFLMVSEAVMNLAWFSYTRCCMSLSNCLTSEQADRVTACEGRDTDKHC